MSHPPWLWDRLCGHLRKHGFFAFGLYSTVSFGSGKLKNVTWSLWDLHRIIPLVLYDIYSNEYLMQWLQQCLKKAPQGSSWLYNCYWSVYSGINIAESTIPHIVQSIGSLLVVGFFYSVNALCVVMLCMIILYFDGTTTAHIINVSCSMECIF